MPLLLPPPRRRSSAQRARRRRRRTTKDQARPKKRRRPTATAAAPPPVSASSPAALTRQRSLALPPPPLQPGAGAVGRLRFGPEILGYGSGGTLVFGGELVDGGVSRPVAVKRLLRQFAAAAAAEVRALVEADAHPNIVRCFALEEDEAFVYLALERCERSVADLVASPEGRASLLLPWVSSPPSPPPSPSPSSSASSSGPLLRPSPFAMRLAEGATRGLAALHSRGIVHRDLKPANVLVSLADPGGGSPAAGGAAGPASRADCSRVAKLSDMGLSRLLPDGASSFETTAGAARTTVVVRGGRERRGRRRRRRKDDDDDDHHHHHHRRRRSRLDGLAGPRAARAPAQDA